TWVRIPPGTLYFSGDFRRSALGENRGVSSGVTMRSVVRYFRAGDFLHGCVEVARGGVAVPLGHPRCGVAEEVADGLNFDIRHAEAGGERVPEILPPEVPD